jgi:hypothetical protein
MTTAHKATLRKAARLLRREAAMIEESSTFRGKWDDSDPDTHAEHVVYDDLMQTADKLDAMRTEKR